MKKRYMAIVGITFLSILLLVGCNFGGNTFYTIEFTNSSDMTMVLNGTVVGNEGFSTRQGVNRVVVIKDSEPVWIGQWELEEGTIEEFITAISNDGSWKVTQTKQGVVGIELIDQIGSDT